MSTIFSNILGINTEQLKENASIFGDVLKKGLNNLGERKDLFTEQKSSSEPEIEQEVEQTVKASVENTEAEVAEVKAETVNVASEEAPVPEGVISMTSLQQAMAEAKARQEQQAS